MRAVTAAEVETYQLQVGDRLVHDVEAGDPWPGAWRVIERLPPSHVYADENTNYYTRIRLSKRGHPSSMFWQGTLQMKARRGVVVIFTRGQ